MKRSIATTLRLRGIVSTTVAPISNRRPDLTATTFTEPGIVIREYKRPNASRSANHLKVVPRTLTVGQLVPGVAHCVACGRDVVATITIQPNQIYRKAVPIPVPGQHCSQCRSPLDSAVVQKILYGADEAHA